MKPSTTQHLASNNDRPPALAFRDEFINGSAIAPALYDAAITLIEDTGLWQPNYALGLEVATQWQTRKPHSFGTLAAITQEDGELWQAKPSNPRPNWKKTKKRLKRDFDCHDDLWSGIKRYPEAIAYQKYEHPKGQGSTAYLPPVPPEIRQRISKRYGTTVPLTGSFWDWLALHPEIKIIFTEGGKKALSLLSRGHVAIALVGIHGGYSIKDRLGNPVPHHLIESVQRFAVAERAITLAFDQDSKPQTRRSVTCALLRFGGLLKAAGCTVDIAKWNTADGKGIDDLIVNRGGEAADQALSAATPLNEWQVLLTLSRQLTRKANRRLNLPSLECIDINSIPKHGIVGIVAPKGCGKTKLTAQLVGPELPALMVGHRIALMRNLCSRLKLHYRGDLDQSNGRFKASEAYVLRVGTCMDSLTHVAFRACNFKDCDLILDEVVQVLRHLLTSSTCNRDGKRSAILKRFEALVKAARRVIVADADLSNDVLTYLETLRDDGKKAFLICNDYQPEPYPVDFIEAPGSSAIVERLLTDVRDGHRVFITTDSKRASQRFHELITAHLDPSQILLINSDTSGGELEQAFITQPNTEAHHYPVVIATPSMATGTSIECEWFERVYGIFYGHSSLDADMSQALARVRATVPRVVWCSPKGGAFARVSTSTSKNTIKQCLQQQLSATASILEAQLDTGVKADLDYYDWANPHVELYSRFAANRNRAMWNLRTALKVRLVHEGQDVTVIRAEDCAATQLLLKETRQLIKDRYNKAVANAPDLSIDAVLALEKLTQEGKSLSPQEQLALEKYKIAQFYLCDVTEALVDADHEGRRRGELARLEATLDAEVATARDLTAIKEQQERNAGFTPWDIPHAALQRFAREQIGLTQWLSPQARWTSDDLEAFKSQCLAKAAGIKLSLGVTVRVDMSGCQILGMLLRQLGLTTEHQQYREEGQRKRRYWLNPEGWQQAMEILDRRRAKRAEASHTPAIEDPLLRVCDTPESLKTSGFTSGDLVTVLGSGMTALIEDIKGAIAILGDEDGGAFNVPIGDLRAA